MINSGWATEEIDNFIAECYKTMIVREIHKLVIEKFPEAQGRTVSAIKHRIACMKEDGRISFNRNDALLYSKEEIEWLKKRCENYDFTYESLTKEFNEKFNKNKTLGGIRDFCWSKLGIRWNQHNFCYTDEQKQWLRENHHKYLIRDLSTKFNERFGTNKTSDMIWGVCKERLNLTNSSYEYISNKEGFRGSHKPLLSERSDGEFTVVKVSQKGSKRQQWIPKQRYIWEQHYGKKVPEDYRVIFLDGNKNNFSINNLACVDRQTQLCVANYQDCSAELKRLKIASFKLNKILSELDV